MPRVLRVICICLATLPALCQSTAKYQVGTITDVKPHQGAADAGSDVVSYDVSIKVAGTVDPEHRTATALSPQKGQIARNDAVIDAIMNREGRRNLPIGFDLVAPGSIELAEIRLPHAAPSVRDSSQLALIQGWGCFSQNKFASQQIVWRREARRKTIFSFDGTRHAKAVLA